MRGAMAGVILLGALTGCSVGADTKLVEAEIASFHRQLDAGQFDAIYLDASSDMKRATTQAELVQLLSAIHRKLGAYSSGKSANWNDNVTTGGHFVTENYASQYARGSASENFVYRIEGQKAVLAGYHINSTALIVN
jgi:hypothetical protein